MATAARASLFSSRSSALLIAALESSATCAPLLLASARIAIITLSLGCRLGFIEMRVHSCSTPIRKRAIGRKSYPTTRLPSDPRRPRVIESSFEKTDPARFDLVDRADQLHAPLGLVIATFRGFTNLAHAPLHIGLNCRGVQGLRIERQVEVGQAGQDMIHQNLNP